jgi:glycerol-3-phosphate dehydrogenase
LLFIIYLNYLPYGFQQENKPFIYADDVSVILTASNETEFKTQISQTDCMTEWFTVNRLSMNTDKTNIMKFSPSNRRNNNFQIM